MGRGLVKMSADQVKQALAMLDSGETLRVVASHFNVAVNTIVNHRDRRTTSVQHTVQDRLPVQESVQRPVHKKAGPPPAHRVKPPTPVRIPQYGDEDYVIRISKAWPSDDWTTWTPEQLDTAIKAAKAEGMNFTACYKETGIDKMILMKYFPEFFRPIPRLAPDPEVPDEVRLVDPITKNTDIL